MKTRKTPFSLGGWHHCYNLSIEGRESFTDSQDYYRFLELLYLANDELPLRRDLIPARHFSDVVRTPRGKRLVAVAGFCLMPNHFHLVLKELLPGGIPAFMRKIGTSYTLYFNSRHARMGNLFLKPFRSIPVVSDIQLEQLVSYVHASPATLFDPDWKKGPVVDPQFLEEHLAVYPYSSLGAYTGAVPHLKAILDAETFPAARAVPVQKMLQEARRYRASAKIP